MEIVRAFLEGFQNHCDGDCSQEIKRCLFLGRKAMTNLDSMLKSRGITLPTQVHLVNVSGHSTFSLNRFQMSKSKLCSSWNQRLYSTTVWRHASIHWCKTESPWMLNKWWSKLEKWWGFPAIYPITSPLLTSVGPQSLCLLAKGVLQVPVQMPLDMVFLTD